MTTPDLEVHVRRGGKRRTGRRTDCAKSAARECSGLLRQGNTKEFGACYDGHYRWCMKRGRRK